MCMFRIPLPPLKFLMTSFLVVPGLLDPRGEACLWTPFVPGLGRAEKLARFCESVIMYSPSGSVFDRLLCEEFESLNFRFFWGCSSSFRCCSCRTRLSAFERGIHLFMANSWPFPDRKLKHFIVFFDIYSHFFVQNHTIWRLSRVIFLEGRQIALQQWHPLSTGN